MDFNLFMYVLHGLRHHPVARHESKLIFSVRFIQVYLARLLAQASVCVVVVLSNKNKITVVVLYLNRCINRPKPVILYLTHMTRITISFLNVQ